jgi:serine/threonine protein kinase
MIGQTISHYTILEKLGEGGMGVVYKAEDTKLKRMVALKFLPQHVSASESDKARFMQEAQAAAALNHPNICTIYGIEEHDLPAGGQAGGQTFIAMEFVDGQTLREKKGTVSFKQAVDIGIQLSDGLAVAHEKGIVHRDIKPENIMIRKDGIAQIMDFGLAKLRASGSKITRLTKEGSTVGTAGYMSPEQVQGQDADHRSDIFSLGVLLYEMFTGQLPFKGVHETALAYEIVNVDPAPMSSVKPDIDPSLDAIVLECLAKEPDERTQSAKQVSVDLKRYRRESSRSRVSRITAPRPAYQPSGISAPDVSTTMIPTTKSNRLPWILSGIFGFIAVAAVAFHFYSTPSELDHPVRFAVPVPEKSSFTGEMPRLSPDGLHLAFVAGDSSGRSRIWIRQLSSLASTPLAGTEDAAFPFWSPDSRYLGFFQNGKLRKIEAIGGPVQSIADVSDARGGSWSSKGIIIYAPTSSGGLMQISEAGGSPIAITTLDTVRHDETHRFPEFLPDGKKYIYLSRSNNDENTGIFLGSIDSKEHKLIIPAKYQAACVPGYLLFLREKTLMAQPFDDGKSEFRGDAFPIAEQIVGDPSRNFGLYSASMNGELAFISGGELSGDRQLAWFDRSGKLLEKVGNPAPIFDFSLSPDEKRVAYRKIDPQTRNNDIWILDLFRRTESRLTFRPSREDDPIWSPDGSEITFDSNVDGVSNPNEKISTGAGTEVLLWKSERPTYPLDWSNDGKYILCNRDDSKTKNDIWVLPVGGDKKPFSVVQTEANEDIARFSPDVRWIAYTSDESRKIEVYVQAFPATQGKWQVSTGGGSDPMWSKDGKEIYYVGPDKQLMVVEVKTSGSSIELGIPKRLFTLDVDLYNNPNRYAVTKDDKRFLVNISTGVSNSNPITVVLNWTSEIKKK